MTAESATHAKQESRVISTSYCWTVGRDSHMNFARGDVFWILDEDTGYGRKKFHVKDLKSLKSLGSWYCGVCCEIFAV